MNVVIYQTDLLPHIDAGPPPTEARTALAAAPGVAGTPEAGFATAEAIHGSKTFFGFLELDYSFSVTPPEVKVELYISALGQKVRIAGVDLNKDHPTAKIGGKALGFKAEVELTYDFGSHELKVTATGCAPFVGCKKASAKIHL